MEYKIGWHSSDEGSCHVALIDNDGKRDELFDVQLYDPTVIEDGVTARERSHTALVELVERANAALGHGCTCDDVSGCGFCFEEAEEYVGKLVRTEQGHIWRVSEVGEKDGWPTLDGGAYWSRPDDVTIVPEDHESYCQNCQWTGPNSALREIRDLGQRVAPGEPMPTGECPECGALCQPIPDPEAT